MRYWWTCTWTKRIRGSTCSISCGRKDRGASSASCSRRVTPFRPRPATRWSAPTDRCCGSPSAWTSCANCWTAWRRVDRRGVSGCAHAPPVPAFCSVIRDGLPQTLVELDHRFVTHELACLVDRCQRVPDFTGPRLHVSRQDRRACECLDSVPQIVDAHALRAPDVEHLAGDACGRRARGEHVCVHDVRDVDEIAGLVAVTVDRRRLTLQRRGDELRHGSCVLRVRILARPEYVEVPQHDGFETVGRVERRAILLARELGGGIGRQRARDMILGVRERGGIPIG